MRRGLRALVASAAAVLACCALLAMPAGALAEPAQGTAQQEQAAQGTAQQQAQPAQGAQLAQEGQAAEANPAMTEGSTTDDLATEQSGVLEATIADLVNADISLNATTVRFTGEVVAAPVIADAEHTWITVSAGGEAISVYMRNSAAEEIKHFGSYDETGDLLDISGTFYLDCETHEGDVDVHAIAVSVIAEGAERHHEPNMGNLYVAVGLVAAGLIAGFIYWRLRERQR